MSESTFWSREKYVLGAASVAVRQRADNSNEPKNKKQKKKYK